MPLVHISLRKGKSTEYIRAIADGVHKALVETFDVPAKDRFQLIRQYDAEDFLFDTDYLEIHRTADVVFIHIVASRTRNLMTKKAFYKKVAGNLAQQPGLRPEDVIIVLSPNEREDWSFGKGLASYVNASTGGAA